MLFHLPRTGVSSIIAALDGALFVRAAPARANKLRSKYLPWLRRPVDRTYLRPHDTALHVRRLLPQEFADYRKIAFVRNPYSWLVSLYELVLQSPNHRHYDKVKAMSGFSGYIDWEVARGKRKQHPYICDRNGSVLVDEIGRFEQLAEDAERIFGAIGVTLAPLPIKNRLTRRDYREFYDAETREKVAKYWSDDLAIFGYDFEGQI